MRLHTHHPVEKIPAAGDIWCRDVDESWYVRVADCEGTYNFIAEVISEPSERSNYFVSIDLYDGDVVRTNLLALGDGDGERCYVVGSCRPCSHPSAKFSNGRLPEVGQLWRHGGTDANIYMRISDVIDCFPHDDKVMQGIDLNDAYLRITRTANNIYILDEQNAFEI
jgi:hypothetical protein